MKNCFSCFFTEFREFNSGDKITIIRKFNEKTF